MEDKLITFWTSLILLPWTLKPLWSPFLELFRTKKFFVVATQLITGVTFGLVAFSLNLPHFFSIAIALLAVVAFSGATHDIACDGVYMSELSSSDQAKYIGWQGAFYNIAKIIATGGLVYLAGYAIESFGGNAQNGEMLLDASRKAWMLIMAILCGVMVLLGIYHYFMLPSTETGRKGSRTVKQVGAELVAVLTDFFRKSHIVYYLFFIILYRFAEGFVMKIVPLFLKADRSMGGLGLTEKEIGLYYGTFGAAAFVLVCCHCFYGMKASYICLSLVPLLLIPMFSVFEGVREDFADLSMLYTGLLYIALPIALSPLIMMDGDIYDGWTMLSFFIVIWVSDVGAYCLGTLFGQKEGSRKLAPEISPKKSWWGFWSGLAFALAAAAGLHFWLWADIPLVHCLVLGAIISVAGVCGDLFESQWKRHYHVKDSGSIIPGHGGMLDRFDSSLVAIPAAAVYLSAFGLL